MNNCDVRNFFVLFSYKNYEMFPYIRLADYSIIRQGFTLVPDGNNQSSNV